MESTVATPVAVFQYRGPLQGKPTADPPPPQKILHIERVLKFISTAHSNPQNPKPKTQIPQKSKPGRQDYQRHPKPESLPFLIFLHLYRLQRLCSNQVRSCSLLSHSSPSIATLQESIRLTRGLRSASKSRLCSRTPTADTRPTTSLSLS